MKTIQPSDQSKARWPPTKKKRGRNTSKMAHPCNLHVQVLGVQEPCTDRALSSGAPLHGINDPSTDRPRLLRVIAAHDQGSLGSWTLRRTLRSADSGQVKTWSPVHAFEVGQGRSPGLGPTAICTPPQHLDSPSHVRCHRGSSERRVRAAALGRFRCDALWTRHLLGTWGPGSRCRRPLRPPGAGRMGRMGDGEGFFLICDS